MLTRLHTCPICGEEHHFSWGQCGNHWHWICKTCKYEDSGAFRNYKLEDFVEVGA